MSDDRPRLTEGAKRLLEEYQQKVRKTVHNIAEKKVIDDDRIEISETDILQAQKSVSVTPSNASRKWGIRVLISLTFTFIVAQVAGFFQLLRSLSAQELPLILQAWLILPAIFVLALMLIFTWVFKEDWL